MGRFHHYVPEGIPTNLCPVCGGSLGVRDYVKRCIRISATQMYQITIRRLVCKTCGKLHRELPDFLLPYKQYPTDCIEEEINAAHERQKIESKGETAHAFPELSSCFRWRRLFRHEKTYIRILSENKRTKRELCAHFNYGNRESIISYPISGVRWLAEFARMIINAGILLCTEFAFTVRVGSVMIHSSRRQGGDQVCKRMLDFFESREKTMGLEGET